MPSSGAAPRHLVSSGNGRTIERRGSAIAHLTVTFDFATSRRYGRCHDFDQRRRKRGTAHQPAALSAGGMRHVFGFRLGIQHHRHRAVVAAGLRMRIPAGVGMQMTILVDMLLWYFVMHMDHAGHMIVVGQARRDGMFSRQRVRDRRRQHAKQIDQCKQPPRFRSPHSRQPQNHPWNQSTCGLMHNISVYSNGVHAKLELGSPNSEPAQWSARPK